MVNEKVRRSVIIAHGDEDGYASAFLAFRELAKIGPVDIFYSQYNQPLPVTTFDKNTNVYILDFSYPRDILLDLQSKVNKILVLDHHKTAEAELTGLDFCIFDMNKSGVLLSWEYFNPEFKNKVPTMVALINDRDLYQKKLANSDKLNAYLKARRGMISMLDWEKLLTVEDYLNKAIERGDETLTKNKNRMEMFLNSSRKCLFEGSIISTKEKFTGCFYMEQELISEMGEVVYKNNIADVSLSYFITSEGECVFSLRSDKFDVSKIAKSYGGGGHVSSAGFKLPIDTGMALIENIYRNKNMEV